MTEGQDGPAGDEKPTPDPEPVADPSDAFQALGNEIRTDILSTVLDASDRDTASLSFSTLFDASDVDTTAGFSYHLDELVGPYLEKDDSGYALTYAGRKVARAVEAGAYTDRVSGSSVPIDDPCPFCAEPRLAATTSDNVVTIDCGDCDRSILTLGFPPTGFTAHEDRLPEAFDRHHRHRLSLLSDGVCPECSGRVDRDITPITADGGEPIAPAQSDESDAVPEPVQTTFVCRQCGYDLRCPVTLTVLEHPAVVSFYDDHDESVRERPIWNVGREWRETPLSYDPIAVCVSVTLEEETLECYVDETGSVVTTRRLDESSGDSESSRAGDDATDVDAESAAKADAA
ncbi:DUF7351 domain-containing protein [Halovivax gelatinilyticus]|uniref:DUF7351 domain-containing protein n=1 Tax=Halovivax gelatinilyticus TaxID=2961597 RepID=UPI0020CA90A4|nr:ArsR family transcriptional regulator [Halovivax gelatinilyticus]